MRRVCLGSAILAMMAAAIGMAQDGPYKVQKLAKVGGGTGSFDYVNSDIDGRKLYVARRASPGGGPAAHVNVYNLDTLEPLGEVDGNGHGAVVSSKSGHGFVSSKPITMFDTKTYKNIKTIDVQGSPDGMLYDAFNDHVYVLSHQAPHVTVINAADGAVLGTIDLGGAPEQAAADGKGTIYIDIEDANKIAVVDAKAMKLTTSYDLQGKGGTCAGLGLDIKNAILFATCRNPAVMVMMSAKDGKIIDTLPIGANTDGGGFNPNTMEAFSSNGDGTLTIVKENSPTSFVVEESLKTLPGAKTMTLDTKTNRILLIGAQYAPPVAPPADAPQPPAGKKGGPGRGPMLPDGFTVIVVGK